MADFDRSKYVEIAKFFSKTDKRYINTVCYTYNGGDKKISIIPATKNTNSNADANKKWIKGKGISGITKEECKSLIVALENVLKSMD